TSIIILIAICKAYYIYYPEFILPLTAFDIYADVFWLILCAMPVAAELNSRFNRRERNGTL
ncbi:cobalt transporter, partial [[Eubacterium] siraeum]|nr:cobalt transporter [[Eubacterium] siraeum]